MRVLLNATGNSPKIDSLNSRIPAPLLTLVDRPFVQHVVETLVSAGARSFDIILSRDSDYFRAALGDGSRWGVEFRFSYVPDATRPFAGIDLLGLDDSPEPIFIASADRLPNLQSERLREGDAQEVIFYLQSPEAEHSGFDWSGWARIPSRLLSVLGPDMDELAAGEALLRGVGSGSLQVFLPPVLSAQTFAELLSAQEAVLSGRFTGIQLTGQETSPGVFVCNNAIIHPTATLVSPVHIGANCRVGAMTKVGPNSVVCEGSIIDQDTTLDHSLVMQDTYVGESLEMVACVVDGNRLVHTRWESAITVTDDMFLASTRDAKLLPPGKRVLKDMGKALSIAALAIALPIIGVAAAGKRALVRAGRA